jgi:glycosyltransferase involved in cell wall biosynthesis
MKPLHIGKFFAPQIGGMERFLEDLIRAQHAAGIDSAAIVHAGAGEGSVADPSWLRRVPVFANVAFAPIAPGFFGALRRAIADFQPDYLHIHLPNLSAFAALFLPSARRLPWVVHWHSDVVASKHSFLLRLLYPLYRPFERALLERAALIICTSRQYLESSAPLAAFQEKCAVVPLGIDPARMAAPLADPPQRWTLARHRLLAVGRLTYYKGFDTLIRAVAQIPDAELRIVGDGQDREQLLKLSILLGVSDRVFLEGALSDTECAALYQTAELFCLPSRERTEAFGVVLLEAMHYGLPLLASAIAGSGVSAVIRNGVNGRLLPPDDSIAWRDAIAKLAPNATERRRLGEAGRERVARKYAIGAVAHHIALTTINWLTPDAPLPEAHERPLIVIPARDEAMTIGPVISEIIALGFVDVLVVDDASTDTTQLEAMKAGARCIRAPLPQGAWGAMQTGIRYAVKHSFSSVITMDADGQHRAHEIMRLLDAARYADVVIGACAARGSPARKFAWQLFRVLTGFNLSDLTSGFRLYNAVACETLADEAITLLDYQDMGVLLALQRAGLTFAEVEVMIMPRTVGVSRIFYSWWAVTRYMLQTVVLCISKRAIFRTRTHAA